MFFSEGGVEVPNFIFMGVGIFPTYEKYFWNTFGRIGTVSCNNLA